MKLPYPIRSVAARVFTHPKYPQKGGNPVTVFVLPPPLHATSLSSSSSSSSSLNCCNHDGSLASSKLISSESLSLSSLRKRLAQSCSWESVIVEYTPDAAAPVTVQEHDMEVPPSALSSSVPPPKLYFYMPSGEEVSFCAHAAMGAAWVLHHRSSLSNVKLGGPRPINTNNTTSSNQGEEEEEKDNCRHLPCTISFQTASRSDGAAVHHTATILHGQRVELSMTNDLKESPVDLQVVSQLLEQIGLKMEHVVATTDYYQTPMINSSVARYKTLIPIATLDLLHGATNPKDADEFRNLCDLIGSTGLYLYTRVPVARRDSIDSSQDTHHHHHHHHPPYEYECRQFPRASGYPEDPATGIAATALACSLYKRGVGRRGRSDRESMQGSSVDEGVNVNVEFVMNQGTAMKRHSRCWVRIVQDDDDDEMTIVGGHNSSNGGGGSGGGRVYCCGTVAIDDEQYLKGVDGVL